MIHAFRQIRLTNTLLSGSGSALVWGGTPVVLSNQTGQYITTAQTGLFYPASNPAGYITSAQAGGVSAITTTGQSLSGVVTLTGIGGTVVDISGTTFRVSGVNTGTLVSRGETGQFVTTAMTGTFGIWTGFQQSFATTLYTGIESTGILFPFVFPTTPRTVQVSIEVTGDILYMANVRSRNVSGYTALFSDIITESGVILHTLANI
jgi:hypothetical protein